MNFCIGFLFSVSSVSTLVFIYFFLPAWVSFTLRFWVSLGGTWHCWYEPFLFVI
jgi:hypothetical protein